MRKKIALLVIALVLLCGMSAVANAAVTASEYISIYNASVCVNNNGGVDVVFSIQAPDIMTQIGAKTIIVQERTPGTTTWNSVYTFSYTQYPQMLKKGSQSNDCSLTYSDTTPGYSYRAKVYFYSENGGYDTRDYITSPVKI